MKKLYFIFIATLLCSTSLFAQQDISLDGEWLFHLPNDSMTATLPASVKQEQTVIVPHTYNIMEGLEDYAGRAIYRRTLPITPNMKGQQIRIHFNGVYHDAIVSVNGKKVGEHLHAGYTPFSFDLTPHLNYKADAVNTLEVICDNSYSADNLPYKRSFDWANDGGIYRSVHLHVAGKHSIRYVHVTPQLNLTDSTGVARFNLCLWEVAPKRITFSLLIRENATGRTVYEGKKTLSSDKDGIYSLSIPCGKVLPWHFDHPNLYHFEAQVIDGNNISDMKSDHFGFRTFTIEGNRFCLNGEQVRLPGIEDMPGSNPLYGMAEPLAYMEKTVRLMKDLNTTITRFHWVQDEARLSLMDSLGILAQEEISWWQQPSKQLSPKLRETAKRQIEEMIEAHYNHPCLFAWGMSNEVSNNQEDILWMADIARRLDSTRLTESVCNHIWRDLERDPSLVLDLPTWNEYTGTWHAKHREQLPGFFQQVEKVLGGRPLFMTEHGLCEPVFTGGDARRVDEMIYHIGEWKKQPFVCGYIYFCVQDYRTQMGEEGLGKHRIRRHGVTTKDLTPKASYYILQQLMAPIDVTQVKPASAKANTGTLANLYEVDVNNRAAEISIAVKQDIPSYTLRGYMLTFSDADGRQQHIDLPDLTPGSEHTMTLPNINSGFHFRILRPDGSTVLTY